MSHQLFHAKQEQHHDQTPLNKIIHGLPPSSSSTTTTTSSNNSEGLTKQQQPPRRPVIIYTHSPKVIHTHPRDFMALVQKLTGYTPPPAEETQQQLPLQDHGTQQQRGQGNTTMDDNESTSVVTEEHGTSVNDIPQVNSCFIDGVGVGVGVVPQPFRATTGYDPYFNPTQVFSNNHNIDYLNHHHQLPFYNPDSMFMNRNSSSTTSLRVLKEYPDL